VPEVGGKVIAINGKRMEPASADGDEEFLRGARLVFERVVEAMDGLDPDAAAQFAGPAIVNEIKHRMNDEHPPAASEVVRVDAKVMSRSVEDGVASVTVYYDAVKNVSGIGPVGPVPIRGIWTFTKDDTNPEAMWMLVSMEPVEA
jgi:predicted lipid-binding transport protein (Tim44 family)